MKTGTKSVLFGAHCFITHPFFLAYAWYKMYGFPFDPRLWIAFFVHDLGYIGKSKMDDDLGELHPYWGAAFMGVLFGHKWFEFTLYHSRYLAKRNNAQYSKLCVADKYCIAITPHWLYLPMVRATGEIHEYMDLVKDGGKYSSMANVQSGQKEWYLSVQKYCKDWAIEHKEIKQDTWTPTAPTDQKP